MGKRVVQSHEKGSNVPYESRNSILWHLHRYTIRTSWSEFAGFFTQSFPLREMDTTEFWFLTRFINSWLNWKIRGLLLCWKLYLWSSEISVANRRRYAGKYVFGYKIQYRRDNDVVVSNPWTELIFHQQSYGNCATLGCIIVFSQLLIDENETYIVRMMKEDGLRGSSMAALSSCKTKDEKSGVAMEWGRWILRTKKT